MASEELVKIKCPLCQTDIEFTQWNYLNAQLHPDIAQRLRDSSLFNVHCSHCKFQTNLAYPMVYDDIEHNVIIKFSKAKTQTELEKEAEECKAEYSELHKDAPDLVKNLRVRIVTNMNDLIEKAVIFHAGYDDRYIEIYRHLAKRELQKAKPELDIRKLRFRTEGGVEHFIISDVDEKPIGSIKFDQIQYNQLKEDCEIAEDRDPLVDEDWAQEYLGEI